MIPLYLSSFLLINLLTWATVPRWTLARYQADAWPLDARIAKTSRLAVVLLGFTLGERVSIAQGLFGLALYLLGETLTIEAMRANPFYTAALRIPPHFATGGPYRFLRHPGYTGGVMATLGTWITFPSVAAGIALMVYLGAVIYRIERENYILRGKI